MIFFSKDKRDGFGNYYWAETNKAYFGFWKNGRKLSFGKFITENKWKYGNWINESQINYFKSEEEAFEVLENYGLQSYKPIFLLTLDDIRNYCINIDEFYDLLN